MYYDHTAKQQHVCDFINHILLVLRGFDYIKIESTLKIDWINCSDFENYLTK